MNRKSVIAKENKFLLHNYARPDDFLPVRGKGSYLWDSEGRPYLDFVSGIAVNALGHRNPELLKAIHQQTRKYIHLSNLYHNGLDADVAEILVRKTSADKAFFCNSGTEANEAAIKFARRFCIRNFGRQKIEIITFHNAFHGRTYGALSATPQAKYQEDFGPMLPGFKYVEYNNSEALAKAVNSRTAAVMLEFLQGEGGGCSATPEFVKKAATLCKKYKVLLIADEVQTGIGRTGLFMSHQAYKVKPDIITLAKPIGMGVPLGAVLMTQPVADEIKPGDHGTTFGGNPVALAAAKVILSKVTNPVFLSEIRRKGDSLMRGLRNIRNPRIGEIRGKGLWIAVEIKENSGEFIALLRKNGLLTVRAGTNFVRFLPPLNVTSAEIEKALTIFKKTLTQS